jgi:hypothetical protein
MRYEKNLCHGKSDGVDDSVGALNIDRVVREFSEGLFANDSIVDEVLSEGTPVCKRLSSNVGEVSGSDSRGSDLSVDNVGFAAVRIEWTEVLFVSLDRRVDRGEDGVRSSSQLGSDTGGLEARDEKVEVVVSLEVRLFLSNGNTVSSPDLSRSFKSGKDINAGSAGGRGGSSSRCGSSGGGGSRSSRGGGSRGSTTCVTHLQVFLEGRGGRDTLAGIFVFERVRVTGISHTSSSKTRSVEEGGGDSRLLGRGEGGGTSNEGGEKGDFALEHYHLVGQIKYKFH